MPSPEENPSSSVMRQFQDLLPEDQHDLIMSVPTFRDQSLLHYTDIGESGHSTRSSDAFLFYSNEEVRMRTISGGIRGAAHESTAPEGIRKTRISFEMHPCVFFDDLLANDSFRNDVNANMNIDDVVRNASPQMAALLSILYGKDLNTNVRTSRARAA